MRSRAWHVIQMVSICSVEVSCSLISFVAASIRGHKTRYQISNIKHMAPVSSDFLKHLFFLLSQAMTAVSDYGISITEHVYRRSHHIGRNLTRQFLTYPSTPQKRFLRAQVRTDWRKFLSERTALSKAASTSFWGEKQTAVRQIPFPGETKQKHGSPTSGSQKKKKLHFSPERRRFCECISYSWIKETQTGGKENKWKK